MSVLWIILPLAICMAGVAVLAFVISVRRGQFDDLDSPPWRAMFNDDSVPQPSPDQSKKPTP